MNKDANIKKTKVSAKQLNEALKNIIKEDRHLILELLERNMIELIDEPAEEKPIPQRSETTDIFCYRVSFYLPIDGNKDYFFGSMSAIYERFTKEQIGCDVRNLWNCRIREGHPYKGQRCTISREPLYRKKRKR